MNLSRDLSIYIGIAHGVVIGITENDGHLVLQTGTETVDLGLATKHLFADVAEYVDRLSIHAVGEDD